MLAAFDFTGGAARCARTAERAFRLPTLLALPPRVLRRAMDHRRLRVPSFHSAGGTIFSLQAVISFVYAIHVACIFAPQFERTLSASMVSNAWPPRFIPTVLRHCENEKTSLRGGFRNIIYRLSIDSEYSGIERDGRSQVL